MTPWSKYFNRALWPESCELNLTTGTSYEAYQVEKLQSHANKGLNSIAVKALPLTDILRESGLGSIPIDILKLDIEGAEQHVFCEGDTS